MANRNVTSIKKLIYSTMINDSALVGYLNSEDSIYQQFPPKQVVYPAVFYGIVNEDPYPFEETQKESTTTKPIVKIEIESEETNTTESDNIEGRLFDLFNGKGFSNDELLVRFCKRSYYTQYYDSEAQLWRTITRYTMDCSPK